MTSTPSIMSFTTMLLYQSFMLSIMNQRSKAKKLYCYIPEITPTSYPVSKPPIDTMVTVNIDKSCIFIGNMNFDVLTQNI